MKPLLTLAFLSALALRCPAAAGTLPLELPPAVYAVVGVECNIYFDNVVLTTNPTNYAFDVDCQKGRNDAKRWRFTPADTDVGDFEWKVKVFDERNNLVASGATTIRVCPANAGKNAKIGLLLVGDSITDGGYPPALRALFDQPGNPDISFLGNNGGYGKPAGYVAHEGRSGFEWKHFLSRWVENPPDKAKHTDKSPFVTLRDGKPILDFQGYCDKQLQGRRPDFITIMLGTNEMINAKDETLDQEIDVLFAAAAQLIAEFKRGAPQAKIGVALPPPSAASQDAFGSNYKCGLTRWQYRRHQFRLVERMIERYGKDSGVSLIPVFCGIDCENNFPVAKEPLNARNPDIRERQSNGVHMSMAGNQQAADCFYAWLKNQLK